MIQAMIWASVLRSGAGMSRSCPMNGRISEAKRRVIRSSSCRDRTRPPIRQVDDCAFPRHRHGQGLHVVQRGVRVVADPALGRPPGDVVMHTVAGVDVDLPGVEADGHRDDEGALGLAEDLVDGRFETHEAGRFVEVLERGLPRIRRLHGS